VKWGESAAVFAAYGVWRGTGSARAGRVLADALSSEDETNRTAAGILLVRAGARSLPLLRANLQRGTAVPLTLRILGDIGGAAAAREIEPYVQSKDPAVARAAADALSSITPPR
jgi:HEAT repeat protein